MSRLRYGRCRGCRRRVSLRDGQRCYRCLHEHLDKYDREPTEAELEATIAEQLKCLPGWWAEESERERLKDGVPERLPRVIAVLWR